MFAQLRALSPYLLGGLLGLLVAIWFWRRKQTATLPESAIEPLPEPVPEPAQEPIPAETASIAVPQEMSAMPSLSVAQVNLPRPWLAMSFQPLHARTTLMGVTIGYRLTLINTGESDVSSVSVAAQMANADAQQHQMLAEFFATPITSAAHDIMVLPAGESIALNGSLSLPHETLNAWRINDRVLFIPFVAFNAVYHWGAGQEGQTAQSYIVGREFDPPADRMAPFRLDQGPREFRPVGCRMSDLAVRR